MHEIVKPWDQETNRTSNHRIFTPTNRRQENSQNEVAAVELLERGQALLFSKNFSSAKMLLCESKTKNPSFEASYYLAKCFEGQNELAQAQEEYLEALLLPTENENLLFETYKNIGNIFLKNKQLDKAEDFYLNAQTLAPQSPQLLVNFAALEMQKGNSSKAIEYYRKALSIDTRFSLGWIGLSLSYFQFGEFQMAWASLLKAIDLDENNTTALLLLTQWAPRHNGQEIALNTLMRFFDQGNFDSLLSLAFVELCIKEGRFKLARWELERSLLWDPKNEDLLRFDSTLFQYGY